LEVGERLVSQQRAQRSGDLPCLAEIIPFVDGRRRLRPAGGNLRQTVGGVAEYLLQGVDGAPPGKSKWAAAPPSTTASA
jgi:hypothetical protein